MKKFFLTMMLLITACAPTGGSASAQIVNVYSTPAAQPWLAELYTCAAGQSVLIRESGKESADIVLRLDQPATLSTPAFQVGTDDVLVVVNRVQPFNDLSADQVRGLFTGEISDWSEIAPSKTGKVQVWVFAQGEDVQEVFAKTLPGSALVSSARLATSPEAMAQAVASDENAIGILSRHWKKGNVAEVYVAASAPVLAITSSAPQGALKDVLACLQGPI
jgi:ABC-type phosphate transport system substrate-binding protein